MGFVGALLVVLVVWLIVRSIIGRSVPGVAHTRFRVWADRGASVLALLIVGGMVWHVVAVTAANRLPRQDVDGSPVDERMDAIIKK